jgi:hypothetical protein
MAADPKKSVKDLLADYQLTEKTLNKLTSLDSERAKNQQIMAERQRTINELLSRANELQDEDIKKLDQLVVKQNEAVAAEKKINDQLDKQRKNRQEVVSLAKALADSIKEGWKYLQESDKVIRSTILNLGMSGAKAEAMRRSFEGSAKIVTRLGGSIADIQTIQQGFADETGRARALTAGMVEDITMIGKGTGLGIEQATKLGAQFEFMGLDAKRSMDYVQGIVDTSERMGVNTTKVLKNVGDNFKKLNTYSFTSGVKGMAKMAEDAEKFQVSMDTALSAADAAKGLEKAIDLAANLQVMGGEFAKTDPFEWMYLARNEPEKLTQKISEMTRGLVTFKKNSEGVFEKFISPADRDRLSAVAKSLGISNEEMIKITQRRADLDKMNKELGGTGLTAREKELVEGAAVFNSKSGKFQVELAGSMKDISTLTSTQAKSFVLEQKTLEERAKQALTFDQTFKATIETLKASLLPLLKGVNMALKPLAALADLASKGGWGVAGAAGILITAGLLWKGVTNKLSNVVSEWVQKSGGKGISGFIGRTGAGTAAGQAESTIAEKGTKGLSGLAEQRRGIGQGAAMAGKGSMMMKGGAGIGAAALGIGAGIGLAAIGISKLADSMSKLDKTQIWALPVTVLALAGAFAVFAPAIIAVGTAGTVSAVGLLALGGAVLGIGAGIGLAAAGIGYMAKGIGEMATSAKGAGADMLQLGEGIAVMAAGMALFSAGGLGLVVFATTLNRIAKHADDLGKVGDAFREINAVMRGSKDDFKAVEDAVNAISTMNTKGGSTFAQLANLLSKPLKVEFDNKGAVQLRADITLDIDSNTFMRKVFKEKVAVVMTEDARINK